MSEWWASLHRVDRVFVVLAGLFLVGAIHGIYQAVMLLVDAYRAKP